MEFIPKGLWIVILIVFNTGFSWGQSEGFVGKEFIFVKVYSTESGLRQSMVSKIHTDGNGLIWVSTGDGLHFFDGQNFTAFRVPINNIYTHSDNLMRNIVQTKVGEIFIATSSSILEFNIFSGKFRIVYRKEGSYPNLLNITSGKKTFAWLDDLKFCKIEEDTLIRIKLRFNSNKMPPHDFVPYCSIETFSDEVFMYNDYGIIVIKRTGLESVSETQAIWIPVNDCQSVAMDSSGNVFVLSEGKIFRYLGNGALREFFTTGISGRMNLFVDNRNNFWLSGKLTNELYKWHHGLLKSIKLCTHEGKLVDTIFPHIRSIFEDNYNNIWFATESDGLLKYSPNQIQMKKALIGFTRCLTWYNNKVWAGTFNGGLWRLSPDLDMFERVKQNHFKNDIYFLDFFTDSMNRLWIASRNGIEVIDEDDNVIYKYAFHCITAKFINVSPSFVCIVADNRLFRFSVKPNPELIHKQLFVSTSVLLEQKEHYWFGTPFGLFKSQVKESFDREFWLDPSKKISDFTVFSLINYKGRIWAATGNGIEIHSLFGEKLPLTNLLETIKNETVYTLAVDQASRVWFAGNQGIGIVSEDLSKIIALKSGNNLQSLEFNSNAFCKGPNGELYFGGIQGVNGVNPSKIILDRFVASPQLLSLFISDTAYSNGVPMMKMKFNLSRTEAHVCGKVFCSDYTFAETQLYSFYLNGYQKKWSKPSLNSNFNYRDLPPGNYQLFARCSDAYNNWSEPAEILSIQINMPFWKTWWFLFLMVVIIVTGLIFIVKRANAIRYQNHIRSLEQQNAIEKERLRISNDMHDEVGASLTRISILSELAKKHGNEPERSKEAISKVSEIAGKVVDEMSEIIWAMNPKNDTLNSFAAYIRSYTSSYLETAGIQVTYHFPGDIPGIPMSSELRRNLFLVIKEALHNAVKHSKAGKITLNLSYCKKDIFLLIRDNGIGFDYSCFSGHGNGLLSMKKRMMDCGGVLQLNTQLGKGTEIQIRAKM